MDIAIQTGATRDAYGYSLTARTLPGHGGEQACFLLQMRARGNEADTLVDECLAILKHSLLAAEGDAWSRLDGTLKELNGLFKGLLVGGSTTEVHALIVLIEKSGELHVSPAGRGEAWLVRRGSASQITEGLRGKPLPSFIHISSGQLESGDTVILSTQRLLRAITPSQLGEIRDHGERLVDDLVLRMQSEDEAAAIAAIHIDLGRALPDAPEVQSQTKRSTAQPAPARRRRRGSSSWSMEGMLGGVTGMASGFAERAGGLVGRLRLPGLPSVRMPERLSFTDIPQRFTAFLTDLRHPERRKRAHFLLVAAAIAAFLIVWMGVAVVTNAKRSRTREQLALLIEQISGQLQAAESRHVAGDTDAANAILERAEEQAKQVIADQSQLYRTQATDLLDRVRQKRDSINNITKVTPRLVADLSQKNPAIAALGMVGLRADELIAYDKQQTYRTVAGIINDPVRIGDDALIIDAAPFERTQTQVFLTDQSSVVELGSDGVVTAMKTDDPSGWQSGNDIETYARFLYMLLPSRNQIAKYERLNQRYGSPSDYNVNADLAGALDMAIDQSIYVLKPNGVLLKLLRGQTQPFVIRQAPSTLLTTATKLYKVPDSNFYFLDPTESRVLVVSDGGSAGEAQYVRQYVLEGEDMGPFVDLYVDPDETRIYVMDAKKVYAVDLR